METVEEWKVDFPQSANKARTGTGGNAIMQNGNSVDINIIIIILTWNRFVDYIKKPNGDARHRRSERSRSEGSGSERSSRNTILQGN